MPIRESERHKYPPPKEWRVIRARILARAGDVCEICGVVNGSEIIRRDTARGKTRFSRVVLTIAHLDHGPTNNADANLAALCQACHLAHDRTQHTFNAARTRARKAGQNEMFFIQEPNT